MPKIKKLQATSGESDNEDYEENENQEEVVNMCFVVIEDEVNLDDNCLYDELSISYYEIHEKKKKLALKHSILEKKHYY